MKKLRPVLLWMAFSVCVSAQPVSLGTSGSFGALAGSTVTNTGATVITGNVGVSPGSAVVGFPPGTVTGGTIHAADATAAQAQVDLTAAYNDAAGRPTPTLLAADIGGTVITPGVYNAATTLGITGTVTFNGAGVYIIQVPSALTTASSSQVVLTGGATAANIFWQVGSSATLGTNSTFHGIILALTSITVTTGAILDGRALARNGAVTLDTNAVTGGGAASLSTTPAPSTLILVTIGLACSALYLRRERLFGYWRKS